MKNSLQIIAQEGGLIILPESEIDKVFSQAFLDANERDGLIIVNNDGPLGYSIVVELTAKGRRATGLPPKVRFWHRIWETLFPPQAA